MGPAFKSEYYEFLYEKSSRNRILVTAKTLFASLGYDNTSTAVIARNAGTSESQLMKHFGGKAGLLETIFSEGWNHITSQLGSCMESAGDPNGRLACIQSVVAANFDHDLELKTLVLLEGHRMRETARKSPDQSGYGRFLSMVDDTLEKAKANGDLRSDLPVAIIRSALIGIIEGGLRDQVLAARAGFPAKYDSVQYQQIFSAFLSTVMNGGVQGQPMTANPS